VSLRSTDGVDVGYGSLDEPFARAEAEVDASLALQRTSRSESASRGPLGEATHQEQQRLGKRFTMGWVGALGRRAPRRGLAASARKRHEPNADN